MIQRIQTFLLGLSIALGPIFWFPVGKMITFKTALFAVLSVLYGQMLIKSKLGFSLIFILIAGLYAISMNDYNDTFFAQFLGVYLDLLCAWIFLNIGCCISTQNLQKAIKISCVICIAYCLLFFAYYFSNTISYFPQEYSPMLSNGTISVIPFSDSGWGFGRTQWSTCLSVFIPGTFLMLPDNLQAQQFKKFFWFGLCIIFLVQLVSGGRGGIVASFLCFSFCLFFRMKDKALFLFAMSFIFILMWSIVYYNQDFFRISGSSLSQDRSDQWEMFGEIFANLPFWGYGEYGNESVMCQFGIQNSFHDSFFRYIFGFGFPALLESIFILFLIIRGFCCMIRHNYNRRIVALFSIILAGFICSFTEPNPIFVAFYWPLWWLSAGNLYTLYQRPENEKQHDTVLAMESPTI